MLVWLSTLACAAQDDAAATARSELAHFAPNRHVRAKLAPVAPPPTRNRWLLAAAGTSAALAASFAFSEGFAARAERMGVRQRQMASDLALDMDLRARARGQGFAAEQRAELLQRVSDICLAGTVAATGATLLIWLTSKNKERPDQNRTLLGPMVLRGMSGGGIVLREKF